MTTKAGYLVYDHHTIEVNYKTKAVTCDTCSISEQLAKFAVFMFDNGIFRGMIDGCDIKRIY